ncbi:aspartyl/asparaginyl beta-hydroxylase-domain containing protein [Nitzschia inconspicua]|uniref:Aspartyl/asparaginyl beta-hydroxylase-domain containing protein n=1 Tax=Nitzschia inconspicua TaxID=303405 RepID=A0A9K3Q0Q1_9STRA|nr:aspartyl/asparaginyl beta-hydroxylase-domain containing protein [Nitzschia inconspicua]
MHSCQLELFSEWTVCDACGLPPITAGAAEIHNGSCSGESPPNNNEESTSSCSSPKKLSVCRNCKCAAYHNVACQKDHWTRGEHRRHCKELASAIQPLLQLVAWSEQTKCHRRDRSSAWWTKIQDQDRVESDRLWKTSVERWTNKEYLAAMEGFQASVDPFSRIWKDNDHTNEPLRNVPTDSSTALILARRLLFCAYCEADANDLEKSRSRLVQCISILLECNDNKHVSELLDDAWMELMLSYEEVPECRRLARHVTSMAISSNNSCCGWQHPLQRPGYMANIAINHNVSPSFLPRQQHPDWCHVLEENWEAIAQELSELERTKSRSWSAVGSGERGSGSDDHRVVSAGGNWKEYVLFGTGSMVESDNDAPITKHLLRNHVPSAVSLAEAGGGEVIFSRLAPGTHIEAHCGPTNLRWTAHLGLVVPDDESQGSCRIRVESEWYRWETGKILLFDDSYEHEIQNDTRQTRTVLLLRVWHPALSKEQQRADLNEARRRKEVAVEKRYRPPT